MPSRNLTDELTTVAGLASAVVEHAQSYGIDIKPICKALDIDPEVFQSFDSADQPRPPLQASGGLRVAGR